MELTDALTRIAKMTPEDLERLDAEIEKLDAALVRLKKVRRMFGEQKARKSIGGGGRSGETVGGRIADALRTKKGGSESVERLCETLGLKPQAVRMAAKRSTELLAENGCIKLKR